MYEKKVEEDQMKIWIVMSHDYSHSDIVLITGSQEKAEEKADGCDTYCVESYTLEDAGAALDALVEKARMLHSSKSLG